MKINQLLLSLLSTLLIISSANAQFNPFKDEQAEPEKTTVALISEVSAIAPNEPFTVAVQLTHIEGWHAYYKNPGGIGLPLSFDWDLPDGYTLVSEQWPTPHTYQNQGSTFYTYSGEYFILGNILAPANAEVDSKAEIKVTANWQICDEKSCLNPESQELAVVLPINEKAKINDANKGLFTKAKDATPIQDSTWEIQATDEGSQFSLTLTPTGNSSSELSEVYFFSDDGSTENVKSHKLTKNDDSYTLNVPKSDIATKQLTGVLYSKTGWEKGNKREGLIVEDLTFSAKPLEAVGIGKLMGIFGGMLLGGLILNLMPCVFPVIGLKIMGFAQQAGEEKKKVVLHGLTFAAGVILSFWVISGLLLSLRNAALQGNGEEVGWGYQLQNPYVVLTILLLMFIMGLNMFGVFEIGAKATSVGGDLQNKSGLSGSFFSGVLATVVATPCSAPFLGAAIGAAFALPNFQFMLAFTAMALGLALPYLFLSIFPNLVKKLPRPGAWMESFKQGMSFLLFATAGYLLWVYVAQTGLDNMLNVVIGLSLIALALWIYGRWNQPHRSSKVKNWAKLLTLLALTAGIFSALPPNKDNQITWEKWSESRVEELLESDTPVFVDFTATWCATCQLNKKRAYSDEVVKMFKEYGIVALKGDKTNASPEIEKKLQELGRTAIPVNVLYVPGNDAPIITPELLSADYMKELITGNLSKHSE